MSLTFTLFAIGSGILFAAFDACRKTLVRDFHPLYALKLLFWLMLIPMGAYAVYTGEVFWDIPKTYGVLLAILIGLILVSNYMFIKALSLSDFSVAAPLLSFIPVFAGIFDYFFFSQSLTHLNALGMGIICIGAFILTSPPDLLKTPLRAFTHIRNAHAVKLILLTSLIWGITAVIDKASLSYVHPSTHMFLQTLGGAIGFSIFIALQRLPRPRVHTRHFLMALLGVGAFTLALYLFLISIPSVPLGIFDSVRRSFYLFATLPLGFYFFGEKISVPKCMAIALMSFGIVCVLL